MAIVSVYRSPGPGCGVRIFDGHVAGTLQNYDIRIQSCNLACQDYVATARTIIHYVPSMWAEHTNRLESVLEHAANGRVLVLLHGMYGPNEPDYMAETRCPDLERHIAAMSCAEAVVLSLSRSCTEKLRLWGFALSERTTTYAHPGLYVAGETLLTPRPYAFVGGVIRPKKDVRSDRYKEFLQTCRDSGVELWAHYANVKEAREAALPIERTTFGLMDDRTWANAISGAGVVLCPYETRIQCVSGMLAEAISAGIPVIATKFPFAVEISRDYPAYVTVENSFEHWPSLIRKLMRTKLGKPKYNSWAGLGALVANLLDLGIEPNQRFQADWPSASLQANR